MLKQMVTAAIALLAGTAFANAADTATGRITHIDPASRTVIVNHVRVAIGPAVDLGGFHLAEKVTVGGMAGARTLTAAAVRTASAPVALPMTGRITHIDAAAGTVLVSHTRIALAPSVDLSGYHLAQKVTVGGTVGAHTLSTGIVASASTSAMPTITGRITNIDATARLLVVNHARVGVAPSVDLTGYHLAQKVTIGGPAGAHTISSASGTITALLQPLMGRVTHVNAMTGAVQINNAPVPAHLAIDVAQLAVGMAVRLN